MTIPRRPWHLGLSRLIPPYRRSPPVGASPTTNRVRRQSVRFRSPAWRGALIGAVCALVCCYLNGTSLVRALENWTFDSCFVLRGQRASQANVVVVAIDDATLDEVHKPMMFLSPELARVIDYLHDQGAAAIGVDFLLPASEETMEYLLPGGPGEAEAMGRAVGRAGNVVLPQWLFVGDKPLRPSFEWTAPSQRPWADLGFVDLSVDSDSCLRRQTLRIWDDQGRAIPCMALAVYAKANECSQPWLAAPQLMLDDEAIPLNADGTLPINYVGPPGTVAAVPFHEVLAAASRKTDTNGAADSGTAQSRYKNAIVLIGVVSGAFKDRYPTPYTSQSIVQRVCADAAKPAVMMSGVEYNANVLATLLDRAFIRTPWWLAMSWLLLITGSVLGAVLTRCRLEVGALLMVGHHLAWRGLAFGAFTIAHWRVEVVSMLLLGMLLYGTIFAMRWRWIRRMMGMVKSEAVARALEASAVALDLRGEQREITVLFCDVRDFTPFSERHSAHEVVRLLNEFFAVAVPAIEAEGGIVNQYLGDGLMVIFGAPEALGDHAARAVRAGIEIVRRVHDLRDQWKTLGAEGFRIGVGIHTGEAVVGTIGSRRRLDYTAIGNTVNTAARIESANKELRTELLISQATFAALPDDQQQEIEASSDARTLSVKGKQETLQVYALRSGDSTGT